MQYIRLVYASRAAFKLSYAETTELLEVATRHNERNGITGVLFYAEGMFIQCLEGPSLAVTETLRRILNDSRHTDIVLLEIRPISTPIFPEWSMKLISKPLPGDILKSTRKAIDGINIIPDPDRLLAALYASIINEISYTA